MAYNRGERPDSPMKRRGRDAEEKKFVYSAAKKNNEIDYKDVAKTEKSMFPKEERSFPEESQETVRNIREL